MTTDELMTEWIDKTARGRVKPRTLSRYRGLIDHHIHPVLGAREIGEVGRRQIADFLLDAARGTREGAPVLSASSVNLLRSVLHGAFAYACDMELLAHNPCERIRRAQEPRGGTAAFSKEEQRLLENAILASEDRRLFGVYLCLYSGLRIGELIGLEWEDVDFTARVLRVTKTVYREQDESGTWRLYVDRPKTRSSERVIPLPGFLMARLRVYRRGRVGPYVVENADGTRMSTRSYQYLFTRLTEAAGVRRLNFHALRHTFATRALECGMDVKTLSELMGHTNASITLNRYCHSLTETKVRMMNKLEKIFS